MALGFPVLKKKLLNNSYGEFVTLSFARMEIILCGVNRPGRVDDSTDADSAGREAIDAREQSMLEVVFVHRSL